MRCSTSCKCTDNVAVAVGVFPSQGDGDVALARVLAGSAQEMVAAAIFVF